jgi:uncharacterized protein (DUF1330 family)
MNVLLGGPLFCVLLWARPGLGEALSGYEDRVLPLLDDHGGVLEQRLRTHGDGAGDPTEVQLIGFPSESAFDAYMADPRRTELAAERDRVIERTSLLRVSRTA